MRFRGVFLLLVFGVFLLLEIYTFYGLKSIFHNHTSQRYFSIIFILQSIFIIYAIYQVLKGVQTGDIVRSSKYNLIIGIVFVSYISKLVFSGLLIFYDGGRGIVGLVNFIGSLFNTNIEVDNYIPSRQTFITTVAAIIASIPFTAMLFGITKGKYNFKIKALTLSFNELPSKFDGLKVIQISDIHSGSFDSISQIEKGVELINSLDPDLVLFTGDLVNSDKNEIDPYIPVFSKIKSRYGKYAVLGNHDYYGVKASRGSYEYTKYFDDFNAKFDQMGFKLLRNEADKIQIEDEYISLIGVENWGAGRYFQKYGDLTQSVKDIDKNDFKILMSHDPTHWDEKILPDINKFHLTLSGHTHGMQFGIDIPWFKWSPAKYRYPRWMGLYEENDQYLYVNRGFGFLGFPGRVGMWPEITSIELQKTVS